MFKRVDRLAIELPISNNPDPNGASAVQELLGGKFGEMSTLNNYMFQSFNFRGKKSCVPFMTLWQVLQLKNSVMWSLSPIPLI